MSSDSVADYAEAIKALRGRFFAGLPARLDTLEAAQARVLAATDAQEIRLGLDDFRMVVHKLAGVAGTHGYHALSEISGHLERELFELMQETPTQVDASLTALLQRQVKAMRAAIGGAEAEHEDEDIYLQAGALPVRNTSRTIVLVEDDRGLAETIRAQLRRFSMSVEWLEHPDGLESAIRKHEPYAVVMDISFPDGEDAGVRAVRTLRERGLIACPVVFLSVRDEFSARLEAVRGGSDGYLVKPVEATALLDEIDRCARRAEEAAYRVLVVDDDEDSLAYHTTLLTHSGMTVRGSREPERTLDELREHQPDVIVLDVNMPACSGFELASIVRQFKDFAHIPVVFLTSVGGRSRHYLAVRSGGDEFVTKGEDPDYLVATVRSRATRSRDLGDIIEHLKESEERFRAVARTAVDGILLLDESERVIYANGAAQRILAMEQGELVGREVLSLLAWESEGQASQYAPSPGGGLAGAIAGRTVQMAGVRRDGERVPLEVSGSRWDAGGRSFFSCMLRDVSERRRAEATILALNRELEQRVEARTQELGVAMDELSVVQRHLTTALESISEGFLILDAEDRLVLRNPQVLEMYGAASDDFPPGTPYETLTRTLHERGVFGPSEKPLEERVRRHMESHRNPTEPYESRLASGRWVRVDSHRTRDGGFVAVHSDITMLRLNEQKLLQAQKLEAVGKLAGGIAHDFNNMLQIMAGYGELLVLRLKRGQDPSEPLAEMKTAVTRAANLTKQLLSFSRQEVLIRSQVDLPGLVREQMNMVRRIIGEDIELHFNAKPLPGPVRADPTRLTQVLLNLFVNARDAMPDGGRLDVSIYPEQPQPALLAANAEAVPGLFAAIEVRDSGTGMPPEVLERLFEPFFSTKEQGKGTGLGLSTTYGIVQQHGGLIQVDSEVGCGTSFIVYLPLEADAETAGQAEQRTAAAAPGPVSPRRVLYAEDDDAVAVLVEGLLGDEGHTVTRARDGEEALRLWQEHGGSFDLLLLDMVMPRMSGRRVLEQLWAEGHRMPVIFCTGYAPEAKDREFLHSDALVLLAKPFTHEQLSAAIRQALG